MFSGLIQTTGTLVFRSATQVGVKVGGLRTKLGDSVAINGVCLTVVKRVSRPNPTLFFDISPETWMKTTLRKLSIGSVVNVEVALKMSDSLGGHIVQGHVDGIGKVNQIEAKKDMKTIVFKAPESIMRYIVPKGSVTVDGVSLTAASVSSASFSVALIPYTLKHTNLQNLEKGDSVNLEADIIGKYVYQYSHKK